MSGHRVRWLCGVLYALTLGCALDGCDWSTEEPQTVTTADAGDANDQPAPTATAEGGEPEERDAALPVLSDEALAARVAAQTRLLGRKALFENIDGKPVPALAVDEAEGNIEDDILDALPGSSGIDVLEEQEATRANGNALGLFVPLEHPKQPALDHFYQALRDLAAGNDADGKVRIAVYGASNTQADIYPQYLRSYFQERFGDGGAGFTSLVRVNRWHRPFLFNIDNGKNWSVEHAQKRDGRQDGYYGYLGASASTTRRNEKTRITVRDELNTTAQGSKLEIHYLQQPGGGKFVVKVDGKKQATVNTKSDQVGPGYHAFEVEPGTHELEVKHAGGGEIRVFGFTSEREQSGVVVDTLAISGTRMANQLSWNEDLWADAIKRRNPDLYTFAFGTNESTDEDQSIEVYRSRIEQVLQRFKRAVPEASCLLIGPGDSARELEEGVWVVRPRLLQIVQVQRDVAWEQGCAFWDGMAFMGGVGSMHTWATSKPRMASRDHIHLTRRGYVRMGMAIADALMVEFDDAG